MKARAGIHGRHCFQDRLRLRLFFLVSRESSSSCLARLVEAVNAERFLILTDPIAQTWMERKTNDLERWLKGMRRMQSKIDTMG